MAMPPPSADEPSLHHRHRHHRDHSELAGTHECKDTDMSVHGANLPNHEVRECHIVLSARVEHQQNRSSCQPGRSILLEHRMHQSQLITVKQMQREMTPLKSVSSFVARAASNADQRTPIERTLMPPPNSKAVLLTK